MVSSPPLKEWFLYNRVDTGPLDEEEKVEPRVPAVADLGRPLFIDQSGYPHDALNTFFASATSVARTHSTNWRYAHSLRVWLNFLARRARTWDTASEVDQIDFKYWRRTDPANPRRISGASWVADVAAYDLFYKWALRRQLIQELRDDGETLEPWVTLGSSRFSTSRIRSADVKWFTPGAYRRWRDIGVLGFDREGAERQRWRPRNEQRDQAFVDGLYGTGLRIQEWSSVMTFELPDRVIGRQFQTAKMAGACAKGGAGRKYRIKTDVLGLIETYRSFDRAASVRRGRANGLYEIGADTHIIEDIKTENNLTVSIGNSRMISMDTAELTPAVRRQLFIRTSEGIEPVSLWLNESGAARAKQGWYKTFLAANQRVEKAGIDRLVCHPHMLRHSFALRWFAMGRLVYESKLKHLGISEQKDFRDQFGDVWAVIQGLLGHANKSTTQDIYLEPFSGLNTDLLLEQIVGEEDAADYYLQVLRNDPRVMQDEWKVQA